MKEKHLMWDCYAPVIWNPCTPPHSGLIGAFTFFASGSEWSPRFLGQKWVVHSPTPTFQQMVLPLKNNLLLPSITHWLKNTVGSHEINRLIFERPGNNPVGNAKTMTSRELPAYQGTKMKCIWGESPHNPPLRPKWGVPVVSNDWCITFLCFALQL